MRSRVRCTLQRAVHRAATACGRALGWLTQSDDRDRPAETVAFADSAVSPPNCPPVDGLPPRAFPLAYPTRSYNVIENEADLVAEEGDETLTVAHPDVPTAYIESDTWTEVER